MPQVARRYAEVWEKMDSTLTAETVAKELIWVCVLDHSLARIWMA